MIITFTASLMVATRYDEQAGVHVAWCPALNIYSQGADESHSITALKSTVELFLTTCYNKDILHKVLMRAGFRAVSPPVGASPREAAEEYIRIQKSYERVFDISVPFPLERVPIDLLIAAQQGGRDACSGARSA